VLGVCVFSDFFVWPSSQLRTKSLWLNEAIAHRALATKKSAKYQPPTIFFKKISITTTTIIIIVPWWWPSWWRTPASVRRTHRTSSMGFIVMSPARPIRTSVIIVVSSTVSRRRVVVTTTPTISAAGRGVVIGRGRRASWRRSITTSTATAVVGLTSPTGRRALAIAPGRGFITTAMTRWRMVASRGIGGITTTPIASRGNRTTAGAVPARDVMILGN